MVVEVNSTQVAKEEVLSNHVYYYELKKTGTLSLKKKTAGSNLPAECFQSLYSG